MSLKSTVKKIADFASEKKAQDLVILDMRHIVNFCDYFVICSGNTDRHVRAIAEGIEEGLSNIGHAVGHRQGLKEATWIIFDLGDIFVHIFEKNTRTFYQLEHLWQEAPIVPWPTASKA